MHIHVAVIACACLLTGACAVPAQTSLALMQVSAVECSEPRAQICSRDYRPVCATRDNGLRCVTTPCDSTETATYANACGACADSRVFSHVAGACPETQ